MWVCEVYRLSIRVFDIRNVVIDWALIDDEG